MKITASDLLALKIIDAVIEEPLGGAHRDASDVIERTGNVIAGALTELTRLPRQDVIRLRREKFLAIGRSIQ
jgi:acetyl-CoA carboxylase carboxyl transferase subunit alpha